MRITGITIKGMAVLPLMAVSSSLEEYRKTGGADSIAGFKEWVYQQGELSGVARWGDQAVIRRYEDGGMAYGNKLADLQDWAADMLVLFDAQGGVQA